MFKNNFFVKSLKTEKFKSGDQEDCHEFFLFMIEKYEEIEEKYFQYKKKTKKESKRKIKEMMEGSYENHLICLECETRKKKKEKFVSVLSFSFPKNHFKNFSLTFLFRFFTSPSFLINQDKFFCDFCDSKTEAFHYNLLSRLPPFFSLHFLTFSYL